MKTILVPIDFSDVTVAMLSQATTLAKCFSSSIHLIHVAPPEPSFVGYEPGPDIVRHQVALELRQEHRQLHDLAENLRAQGIEAHASMIQGATIDMILERARKTNAELIILGSHGHGAVYRALLGSVSEGVVRHAPCPVLIIPAKPQA